MKTQAEVSKAGSFQEFQDYTLAVARLKRMVNSAEPKIWIETRNDSGLHSDAVQLGWRPSLAP